MQSENFDKKIRDSLSQRPPGNDNPAWDKMEPLLDKHMPQQKKDRRRFFFILFLSLFIGGATFFIWRNGNGEKTNLSAIESQKENAAPENNTNSEDADVGSKPNNTLVNKPDNTSAQKVADTKDETLIPTRTDLPVAKRSATQLPPNRELSNSNLLVTKTKKNKTDNHTITENSTSIEKQIPEEFKETKSQSDGVVTTKEAQPVSTEEQQEKIAGVPKKNIESPNAVQQQDTKGSQPSTAEKTSQPQQKNKRSFFDNLFFSVSAGADLSAVGVDNVGKVKPIAGAGIGYRVSDKFSIRTGFYSARKIYTADPDDYHPPYNVAAYYPNLKTIDANCKVYEVPLTIDFTFSKNKKQSWFVAAGASTLIMKKETYDYYYKPNNSPTYITYSRTINDENKHYFSVLSLSAGYSRTINKNLSVQAEPYFKIAMKGIGYGKVNLNSSGILVSAVVKPFAKK